MKLTAILFSLLLFNCQSNSKQTNMSETTNAEEKTNPKSIHSLSIIGLDGNTINLADFKGKKYLSSILLLNVDILLSMLS